MEEQKQSVKVSTIVRTICLAITTLNTILTFMGKNPLPFSDDLVYQYVSIGADFIVKIVCWWKNNSFTGPAILADSFMKKLKSENK